MHDVRSDQIWETCKDAKSTWRRVKVINVLGDTVDLEYLDAPGAPNPERIFTTTQSRMLATNAPYRFVRDAS
jgi:hypothetical protein